jgi:hypothetical protein
MPSSTSNLSVDEQQAAATIASKRKEEDVATAAQATVAITQ